MGVWGIWRDFKRRQVKFGAQKGGTAIRTSPYPLPQVGEFTDGREGNGVVSLLGQRRTQHSGSNIHHGNDPLIGHSRGAYDTKYAQCF